MVIAQVLKAASNDFTMFGMTFSMVSIVAIVRNIDHSSTKITYMLEDHTGQIEAHYWLEEGDTSNTPALLLNTYAKVFGSIRNSGGSKLIMIFRIETTSLNELTTHLLEVLNARYMAEEYSKTGYKPAESSTSDLTRSNTGFNASGNDTVSAAAGLKGKQLLVFEAVKTLRSDAGVSLQELQTKFSHIPAAELLYVIYICHWQRPTNILFSFSSIFRSITEFLSSEGHIYSSIDSEHFLPTDAE